MPKQYLITLSIGPVQDFIAAARRTRDLWFGSHVLSEVSKAAALSFQGAGAELIFPPPKTDLKSRCNVGNKLLVVMITDNPKQCVVNAKEAAQKCWKELAEKAEKEIPGIKQDIWTQQISDVLEIFGAWIVLEKESDYASDQKGRKYLERLLSARKNTKEFIANPVQGDEIAKSSLDGLRESVLPEDLKYWQKRKLGLNPGEHLDCIGVVKRLGGKDQADQFTPLSRLAIDPWLRYIESEKINISDITDVLYELTNSSQRIVSPVMGNDTIYDFFPYDGQLLYDTRIEAETNILDKFIEYEEQEVKEAIEITKNHLGHLNRKIKQLFEKVPKPTPYLAILVADGDHMGKLLDKLKTIEKHQAISEKLAEFATRAPETIRKYRGHCVYAGGDDVLALLPLDRAIACAAELEKKFREQLKELDTDENSKTKIEPTLSVGLGVSHFMTPMNQQLALARRAESLAKSNHLPEGASKNALAILLQPRAGAEISFRERWDNQSGPPDKLLGNWIQAHLNDALPSRFGYELREEAAALSWCHDPNQIAPDEARELIEKETFRILDRKQTPGGERPNKVIIEKICTRVAETGLEQLAGELIITRRFAEVHRLSGEKAPGQEST